MSLFMFWREFISIAPYMVTEIISEEIRPWIKDQGYHTWNPDNPPFLLSMTFYNGTQTTHPFSSP